MESKAAAKYVRISPRKARLIFDLIKGKQATEALSILEETPTKSARFMTQVLKSAIANAEAKKMNINKTVVVDVRADEGPTLKRLMPRSMGRADRIFKRTSHLSIQLSDEVPAVAGKN